MSGGGDVDYFRKDVDLSERNVGKLHCQSSSGQRLSLPALWHRDRS